MKKLVLLLMVLTGYALRAQTTGDLLTTFTIPGSGFTTNTGYSPAILDAAIQGDNKILLAGSFYYYNGVLANNLIRLLPNGIKDPNFYFNYTVNGQINKVAVHSDGKIYIAGTFNSIGGNYRNGIAQLNHNGGLNFTSDFSGSGPNSTIWAMALQSDGKILIGGNFTEYNGTATNKIVRLNTDGSLDTSFNVSTTDYYHYTNDIVVQPDGKILVAHATNYSDPSSTRGVVRLNTDGSLDTTFSAPVFNYRPTAISLQSDGKLVVGGEFTQIGTQNYPYVARLNADGSLDTTFTVGSGPSGATPASENIKDIQVTSDDKILVGGAFTSYNGVGRKRVARLNIDGSLDTGFDPGTGAGPGIYDRVNVVQEDLSGQYYIGGTFTQYNGVPRSCVAKIYGNLDNNLTYIPDDNFEQRLIDLAYDDVLDDYVLTNNISGLTNLDINYKYISDLTGIEDFIALEYFTLDYNNITDLDLSANTQLINLSFRNNTALNTVNITQSTHIKYIDFSETNLTTIDVSQNTELLGLLLINNDQLTTLDLTQNTQLTYLNCFTNNISNLDLSQNTALVELQCQYNNLTTLDVSNNLQLEYLYCLGNNLTSLDVSQNLNLRLLNCFENNLTSLDLNQNTLLKYFYCQDNELTSLSIQNGNNYNLSYFDATGNSGLTCIAVDDVTFFTANFASSIDSGASYNSDCTPPQPTTYVPDDNFEQKLIDLGYDDVLDDYVFTANISGITSLNVSSSNITDLTGIEDFTALQVLNCAYNNLASINVSQLTALTELRCYQNSLTSLDVSQNTSLTRLNCNYTNLTQLDVTQNSQLEFLECSNTTITALDISQNHNLVEFKCHNGSLTSLTVIGNTSEAYIDCVNTNLTSLDISNCANLTGVVVNNSQLTTFNATGATSLIWVELQGNQLQSLDFSTNSNLMGLFVGTNMLTLLNIKNNNNSDLLYFGATNNPDLVCVAVDNVSYFNGYFPTSIDSGANYNTDCGVTYVPDDNFEQALIDLGYDNVLDDYVLTATISGVTSLNVGSLGINDLTGIEDFAALQLLNCSNNNLVTLNVNGSSQLSTLICNNNSLTSLEISQCTQLIDLNCASNNLATLDVAANVQLYNIYCDHNNLSELDLSFNFQLMVLSCANNNLSNLNVSYNTQLTSVNFGNNNLTSFNGNNNSDLEYINAYNNQLTELYFQNGNNTAITYFIATGNPDLACVLVDDVAYFTTNFASAIDSGATYTTYCDSTLPTVITQNITVFLNVNGEVTIAVADINNGSYDDVAIQTMTLDVTDFTCADIGTNTVTLTVEDTSGNIATATAVVTVEDTTAPVIPTLADVTGECSATAAAPITTDNCMGTITGTTTTVFPISTIGTTVVTWTFDDGNGNIVTANQNVIVTDTTAPVIPTLADVTGECMATVTAPTTTDNCMGVITGTTTTTFPITTIGTTVVTWTFDDGNGNMVTANQNVIVTDTTAPVIPTLADVTGECMATVTTPTTTDNCMGVITGTTTTVFPITTIGTTVVTWTFDDGNGNIVTANQNVIVTDTTAPVIPTLADVTGECSVTSTAPTTTDNCMGTITGTTTTVFPITTIGTTVVTWTFDDGNGNMVTANQNVIVTDTTAPVIPTLTDVTGECMATATAPTTTDNCMGTITGTTTTVFPISTIGTTVVTWTFDDGNGNIVTANQNVIVTDTVDPIAMGTAIEVDLNGTSSVSILPEDIDNGSYDLCSAILLSLDVDTFTAIGTYNVLLTVTDTAGNIATVLVVVTVIDSTMAIEEVKETVKLKVYPVPANSYLNIESNMPVTTMQLIDTRGRLIATYTNPGTRMDVSAIAAGMYTLRCTINEHSVVKKIVIE